MKDKVAARRYAEGFLSYAKSTIGLERGFEELTKADKILSDFPQLKKFFENLEITYAERSEAIDKIFKEGFSDEIRQFLKLITKKGRIDCLLDIADYAKVVYYREKGIENAVLKTALPIGKELTQRIKSRLEERLNKKLELEVEIEPNLIGGVAACVGNVVIDGSVKRRLAELKEDLMAIKVH